MRFQKQRKFRKNDKLGPVGISVSNNGILEVAEATSDLLRAPVSVGRAPFVAPVSRWRLIATLQVCEALAVAASCGVWLAVVTSGIGLSFTLPEVIIFGLLVSLAVHFLLRALGAYEFIGILNAPRSCATAAFAWVLATSALQFWTIKLAPHHQVWRVSLFYWIFGGLSVVLVRTATAHAGNVLLRARRICHNVAIVGSGDEAQLCAQLLRSDRSGASVVGFVALDNMSSRDGAGGTCDPVAELRRLIQQYRVGDIIVASSENERAKLPELVRGLSGLPVRVLLWPRSCGMEAEWLAPSEHRIGAMPLLLASVPPLEGWRWVLKDARDRLLAACLLFWLGPVLLAAAVAIRLSSPGPILFRQEREGYNGRSFTIFKFRTMRDAEPPPGDLLLTVRQDPRVFPVGALLRKTSLDELPQLLNVLRGDMWLVGPRPHSPLATAAGKRYAAAVQEYMSRFRVKPGITGWAQVNGWRGPTNTVEQLQQRIACDCYYIENISAWLDLQILLRTAAKGFVHHNAF